jgi:hypothetical protein
MLLPKHPATNEPGSRNVLLLRNPSDARIGRFLDDQRSLPFSYPEVDASRDGEPPTLLSSMTIEGMGPTLWPWKALPPPGSSRPTWSGYWSRPCAKARWW